MDAQKGVTKGPVIAITDQSKDNDMIPVPSKASPEPSNLTTLLVDSKQSIEINLKEVAKYPGIH
jgi:hypothetical protein